MIDDYLAELRRRGVTDPETLAEIRAHLEDAAAVVGATEALARFGDSRAVARSFRRFPWPAFAVAALAGAAIAYVDSRPGWDATGITAVAVFAGTAAVAAWVPRHEWRWALLVGGVVPLVEVPLDHNTGSFLALAFAGVGAAVGRAVGLALAAA